MEYVKTFEATKQALLDLGATINKADTELVLTKEELPYYEESGRFEGDCFDFYSNLNGLDFDWSLQTDRHAISGFINILSFEEMIEKRTEHQLWSDWYEKDDLLEIKKHHIFEKIVGTDYYVTLRFDRDLTYKLFYVPEGSVNHGGSKKLSEIPLTISQYFAVVAGWFGVPAIRHHLHHERFYTHPFDMVPELSLLEALIPNFQPPQI